jgi:hypothetical protein
MEHGIVTLQYLETKLMPADFLTKAIDSNKFQWCREQDWCLRL